MSPPGAPNSINDCAGKLGSPSDSPILDLMSRFDDAVDLVISAHTHVGYNRLIPNSKGRPVPLTQAGAFGRMLTNIDLTLDKHTGHVTKIVANNLLVSQSEADTPTSAVHPFLLSPRVKKIRALLTDYEVAVNKMNSQIIGSIAAPLPETVSLPRATGRRSRRRCATFCDRARRGWRRRGIFGNASGVRADFGPPGVTYPHEVTYGEAFSVRPFGNTLMTITLTAQNLKDFLEQQFNGCNGQTQDSPLEVSEGFHFEWSASAAPCQKIVTVILGNETIVAKGVVQNPTKSYRITVDNFLGAGKGNFSVLLQGTNPTNAHNIDSV